MLRRRLIAVCAFASLVSCMAPRHHWSRIEDRHHPRQGVCDHPEVLAEHPTRRYLSIAVVTAECRESKPEECRDHLQLGACEAGADAMIDMTNDTPRGMRRMVATGIEYVPEDSGGEAAPRAVNP